MRPYAFIAALLALSSARADEPKPAIAVSADACATLVPGAAYVPGVDQAGNAVAPADLPREPQAVTSDTISIEINPKIAGQFGVPARGTGAYGTLPILGYVTVTDGRAYFNGKPLAPEATDAVVAACQGARK